VLRDRRRRPLRVLECRRAEIDAPAAGRQRRLESGRVADATGELDLQVEAPDDRVDELTVGTPAERGVEVDEVEPLRALVLPCPGGVPRVAELAAGAGHALHELHRPATSDVDRRQQLEAGEG